MSGRQCGGCTLCCKLLPMSAAAGRARDARFLERGVPLFEVARAIPEFDKAAGARCPLQRAGHGCKAYAVRPLGCRFWSCAWLRGDDTGPRPDRAHYVVDESPDFVTNAAGVTMPVVQVWIDRDFPDAHRDPALRRYLLERWERDGHAALIRFDNKAAMFLYHDESGWHERTTSMNMQHEHTVEEKFAAGLGMSRAEALSRLVAAIK